MLLRHRNKVLETLEGPIDVAQGWGETIEDASAHLAELLMLQKAEEQDKQNILNVNETSDSIGSGVENSKDIVQQLEKYMVETNDAIYAQQCYVEELKQLKEEENRKDGGSSDLGLTPHQPTTVKNSLLSFILPGYKSSEQAREGIEKFSQQIEQRQAKENTTTALLVKLFIFVFLGALVLFLKNTGILEENALSRNNLWDDE